MSVVCYVLRAAWPRLPTNYFVHFATPDVQRGRIPYLYLSGSSRDRTEGKKHAVAPGDVADGVGRDIDDRNTDVFARP